MLSIEAYAGGLYREFPFVSAGLAPWDIVARLADLLAGLGDMPGFPPVEHGLYIHPGATIEPGAVVKPPALIGDGCFIAAHAYLRGGVALGRGVSIGPGCEVKASLVVDAGHRLPADGLWRARPKLTRAGDAVAPRSIYEAILEGRRAAAALSGVTA